MTATSESNPPQPQPPRPSGCGTLFRTLCLSAFAGIVGAASILVGIYMLVTQSSDEVRGQIHKFVSPNEFHEDWETASETQLERLRAVFDEEATKTLAELNKLTTEFDQARKLELDSVEKGVADRWEKALSDSLADFERAISRSSTIETTTEKRQRAYASNSLQLAKDRAAAGDTELATFYLFAAIANASDDFGLLQDAVDHALETDTLTVSDFNRIASILELAIYEVNPQDVGETLALNESVKQKFTALKSEQIDQTLMTLQDTPLEEVCLDEVVLRERHQNLIATLQDSEDTGHELLTQLRDESIATQRALEALLLLEKIEFVLGNLDSAAKAENWESVDQTIHTLETQLVALSLVPQSHVPTKTFSKIQNLPKRTKSMIDTISLKRHQEAIKEATVFVEIWKSKLPALEAGQGSIEKALDEVSKKYSSLDHLVQRTSSLAVIEELRSSQLEIAEIISMMRKKQFDGYQSWAIGELQEFFDEWYRGKNPVKGNRMLFNGENYAENMVKKHQLEEIDPNLLSPEVRELHQSILVQVFADCNAVEAVGLRRFIAESTKVSLQDF